MTLVKRPAEIQDGAQIAAKLIYSSGPDIVDYLHQGREGALAFAEFEFSNETGFSSFRNIQVLADDSGIVATAALTDHETHLPRLRETVSNLFKHYRWLSAFRILLRFQKVKHLFSEPGTGEIYLANFAVREDLQGQGYGRKFLTMLIDDARKSGYKHFTLDVSAVNHNAQNLYRSMGLKAIKNTSCAVKGIPGGIEMVLKLE